MVWPWVWVLPTWVTRRQLLLCKPGPGALSSAGRRRLLPARDSGAWPETLGPGPRRSTHLEHDFVDSSSVRFEVEVLIVVIA